MLKKLAIVSVMLASGSCVASSVFIQGPNMGLTDPYSGGNSVALSSWNANIDAAYGSSYSFYQEGFEGFAHNEVIDSRTAATTFGGGMTFRNGDNLAMSQAIVVDGSGGSLGYSSPIGSRAWQGNDDDSWCCGTDETPVFDFGEDGGDFLGFFITDAGHFSGGGAQQTFIDYKIQYSDGSVEWVNNTNLARETNTTTVLDSYYLFTGFVNTREDANFDSITMYATLPSRFGIDDVMWGNSIAEVPVPAAAWLFGSALIGLVGIKRKK